MNKLIGAGVVVFLVIIIGALSFGTIATGHIGVETRFGRVVATKYPGSYFIIPFVENVTTMDTQTQKDQVEATAASNDLQQTTATVAVNYHVEQADAATIYSNIGADYADRIIAPAIQESVKSVTANYTAEQLITKRETVRDAILGLLTTKLQVYGIQTDSLNIVNFAFSDTFNAAIEAKVTAQQNALAAQNKLQQVQFEAQQTIATAQATAEAQRISSAALAAQGGADYVQLKAIEKWDGHLPTQMIPGSSVPFLNLKN